MSGRFLPASRSLRGFRSGSSISICLFLCSRASSSTARCSMAARDSGVKGRRQWGPGGTREGRDELAILAFWAQGPEGGRQRQSSYSPQSLGFGWLPMPGVYCVLLTLCLPRGWLREVGVLVLLGLGDVPASPGGADAQDSGHGASPTRAPRCSLLSKRLCHLQDQQKANQIFSSLRNLGPMPQCPERSPGCRLEELCDFSL